MLQETSQPVQLYRQKEAVVGNIPYASVTKPRLSDVLNGATNIGTVRQERFLQLTGATIRHTDGVEENLEFPYVSIAAVHLAITLGDKTTARVIQGKKAPVCYPFVEKSPRSVWIETSGYAITGDMYCMNYQSIWGVLEDNRAFLPLTGVNVHALANDTWEQFSFAAVNKEQIMSLSEVIAKSEVGEK
jgi:hypothetical protein